MAILDVTTEEQPERCQNDQGRTRPGHDQHCSRTENRSDEHQFPDGVIVCPSPHPRSEQPGDHDRASEGR